MLPQPQQEPPLIQMLRQLQRQQQYPLQPPLPYQQPPQVIHVASPAQQASMHRGVSVGCILAAFALVILAFAVGIAFIIAILEGYSFYWQWGFLPATLLSTVFLRIRF